MKLVVPRERREGFRLFAYRIAPHVHRGGGRLATEFPCDVHPEAIPPGFHPARIRRRKSIDGLTNPFEHSPLSCNYLAAELDVNEFCLFSSLDAALAGADAFSLNQPEPGDYYVIQVLEAPGTIADWNVP